jgi:hypothetical protein
MSIALPFRRRRTVAEAGWVWGSEGRPLSALPTIVEFVPVPAAIFLGTSFFARAVQILWRLSPLRQRAVGSLPESKDELDPEHHIRDVRGEGGLSRRLAGEA